MLICHTSRDIGHTYALLHPPAQKEPVSVILPVVFGNSGYQQTAPSNNNNQDTHTGIIPSGSSISIYAFVSTTNSHGQPATNQAGSCLLSVKEIYDSTRTGPMLLSKELIVWNANSYKKGTVLLRFEKGFLGDDVKFSSNDPLSVHTDMGLFKVTENVIDTIKRVRSNYTDRSRKYTWPSMESIHAPIYKFSANLVLPGFAYSLLKARPSSEAFWTNLLDIAIRRTFRKAETMETARSMFMAANDGLVLEVEARMHCIFNNYCTYLTDEIDSNEEPGAHILMESFDACMRFKEMIGGREVPPSADCEDYALNSALESLEIRDSVFTVPALLKLQAARKKVFCLMVLKGVCGPSVDDMTGDFSSLSGHMDAMFVPICQFAKETARANNGADGYGGEYKYAPEEFALPKLVMEGTGIIHPSGVGDDNTAASEYLESDNDCMELLRHENFQPKDKEHCFYKAIQSAFIMDVTRDGFNTPECTFITQKRGGETLAVSYKDYILNYPDCAISVHEHFTSDHNTTIRALLSHTFPIPPYPFTPNTGVERNEFLDSVKAHAKSFGRSRKGEVSVVDYIVPYFQATSDLSKKWRNLISDKKAVVDFDYFHERVTDMTGGFLCRFFVMKNLTT